MNASTSHSSPPAPNTTERLLLNRTDLARCLGVDRRFVTAMCHHTPAPFEFSLGGRTTLADALTWLRNNPSFKGCPRRPKAKRRNA